MNLGDLLKAGSDLAVTVALILRMDGGWQCSQWAWALLAMAVVARGAASTELSVSGVSLSGALTQPLMQA